MENNMGLTSMHEVARVVMNAQKLAKRFRQELIPPNRDLMRRQFIMATTPPPQRRYDPEPLLKRKKGRTSVRRNEEGEETLSDGLGHDEYDESSDDESDDQNQDYYQRKQKELDEFYKKLVYDLPDSPKTTKRTAALAKPKKNFLLSVYEDFGRVLEPERRKRIKRKVQEFKVLTTEELEQQIKNQESKKKDEEKIRKKRYQVYRKMLARLERQCKEKVLEVLYKDFSNYVADCAVAMENVPEVCPANVQRLIDVIQHNIYQTCKIQPEDQYINCSLYRAVSSCIAWLIVDVLYSAQFADKNEIFSEPQNSIPNAENVASSELHDILKRRAMIAAKKKCPLTRENRKLHSGPPPKMDEIVKLFKLIGGR